MPDATRPLLKQIDALQQAMNGRTVAWEAVEARNSDAQQCRASPFLVHVKSVFTAVSRLNTIRMRRASLTVFRCSLSQRLSESEAGLAVAIEREKSAQRLSANMKTQAAAAEEKIAIAGYIVCSHVFVLRTRPFVEWCITSSKYDFDHACASLM